MKKTLLTICLLLPAFGMSGECGVGTGGSSDGSDGRVASVVLRIVDEDGDTIPEASVLFSVDGSGTYQAECDGDCDDMVLVYQVVGEFEIIVGAPGRTREQVTVVVEANEDETHPVTEEVTVVLEADTTVSALHGVWRTTNVYGTSDLRFDSYGRIVGAILYDRTAAGDGNIYIAYNGNTITGVAGQNIVTANATDPTRVGDVFDFVTTTLSYPVGFEDATMTDDLYTLVGTLTGTAVTYTRLNGIPDALQTP
jgi:hypothetical protein